MSEAISQKEFETIERLFPSYVCELRNQGTNIEHINMICINGDGFEGMNLFKLDKKFGEHKFFILHFNSKSADFHFCEVCGVFENHNGWDCECEEIDISEDMSSDMSEDMS